MDVGCLADGPPGENERNQTRCAELANERSALTIVPARREPPERFEVRSWPMN
jgi:hypothetical protein